MKLAWLVYRYEDDPNHCEIQLGEPERWLYYKVIPIVYAEIQR